MQRDPTKQWPPGRRRGGRSCFGTSTIPAGGISGRVRTRRAVVIPRPPEAVPDVDGTSPPRDRAPFGCDLGLLLHERFDSRAVRIERGRALDGSPADGRLLGRQGAAHGLHVQAQPASHLLLRNTGHFVHVTDFCPLRHADHLQSPPARAAGHAFLLGPGHP